MREVDIPGQYRMLGRSAAFMQCWRNIQRFASHNATILICGETGTGKELAARALHYLGARAPGPFVPINCGAIPDSLLESEFFGHEKGAFTDARAPQPGLVKQASGGTLLLDEVEALSSRGQTVLLRFLEDSHYRAVGGRQEQLADVRVVAVTNSELADLVGQGVFRQDLMYRLSRLVLRVPPLRSRASDITIIANALLESWSGGSVAARKRLSIPAAQRLEQHTWPGNIRELENVLLHAFLTADGDEITELQLDGRAEVGATKGDGVVGSYAVAKQAAIEGFERVFLTNLMDAACGNITRAAQISHQHRSALSKLLKKYGVRHAR